MRGEKKHMQAWIKDTAAPAPAQVVVVVAAELNAAVTARQYSGLNWIRTPLHAGGGELPLVVPDIKDSFQGMCRASLPSHCGDDAGA